jgi:hypothetical protein
MTVDPLDWAPVGLLRSELLDGLHFELMAQAPGVFASVLRAILRLWKPLSCRRPTAGELERMKSLLERVSLKTAICYLGYNQLIKNAVNDCSHLEPDPP